MQVYKIELWLKSHEKSSSEVIVDMVGAMKVKFDKYWREYSVILAMAAVFDPRFKLSLLDYCFTKLDDGTAEQKVVHVSDKLELLFKAYSKPETEAAPSPGNNTDDSVAGVESSQTSLYDDFYNFRKNSENSNGKSALDMYLEEPLLDVKAFPNLDVLSYWKDNSHRFVLIQHWLTSSKYRSCLLPRNVQALICARNWIRDFEPYDNDIEVADHGDQNESLPPFQV
ncbi:BnaC01g23430D [Brassica napus]|uniref:BnaC01g23430D protein n=1 Tax=Brassica napus TaxID=3708 RepID=A0A078FV74_BRANA|nr:BnaC01g23430D [Brassica napus]